MESVVYVIALTWDTPTTGTRAWKCRQYAIVRGGFFVSATTAVPPVPTNVRLHTPFFLANGVLQVPGRRGAQCFARSASTIRDRPMSSTMFTNE